MNLTIDIGNTRTKFGFFHEQELIEKIVVEKWRLADLKKIVNNQTTKTLKISSVLL